MSKKHMKNHIPLLHTLNQLTNDQRQIIIDHLDPAACASLTNCVAVVLKKGKQKLKSSKKKACLKRCVHSYKPQFSAILSPSTSVQGRQRALARVGGNPLGFILSAALPIVLEHVLGK